MITTEQFARAHLYPYTVKGEEIVSLCPYCKGGEKRDKGTFALNTVKLTYNCLRGKCGVKGTFWKLCKDFNENVSRDRDIDTKTYTEQKKDWEIPQSPVMEYMQSRGISKPVVLARGVGEKDGNIIFPYYENDKIVLIKYRKPGGNGNGPKSWRGSGGKAVFWGMEDCNPDYPLVIVEGEIDALTLDECGIPNVVSVPSGAKDLNCVTNCWDWMTQFKKIIIWGDKDIPGQEMVDELVKRLSEEWLLYIVHSEFKDANEELLSSGKGSILRTFSAAAEVPLARTVRPELIFSEYNKKSWNIIKSGLYSLDDLMDGGFITGEVSLWTGENLSGKSVFVNQLVVESIQQGKAAYIFSGELVNAKLKAWIDVNIAGEKYIDYAGSIREDVLEKIRAWYTGKMFFYDDFASRDAGSILDTFANAAKRYGCKLFVIDNLMSIAFPPNRDGYYRQQSDFVANVVAFAHRYDVHVHIVAHPRKTDGKITKMDVSGSGDLTNRADNVFLVNRVDEDKSKSYQTEVELLKCRTTGKRNLVLGFFFRGNSRRYFGSSDSAEKEYWNSTVVCDEATMVKLWEDA